MADVSYTPLCGSGGDEVAQSVLTNSETSEQLEWAQQEDVHSQW